MKPFNFANYVAAKKAAATKPRDRGGAPKPGAAARAPKPKPAATKADMARKLREARAAGVAEGRLTEKARIAAILSAGGLGDHEAAALAIGTDLSAKAAVARLNGDSLPPELAAAQRHMMEGAR